MKKIMSTKKEREGLIKKIKHRIKGTEATVYKHADT